MKDLQHVQGFFVTAIAGIVLLSTSCNTDKGEALWWEGERERVEIEQELALKTYRFNELAGNDFETLQGLTVAARDAKEALAKLRDQRRNLEAELASLEKQWPEFRDDLLRDHRHQMIGKTFETLKSSSGREYKNVTVAQIDNAGVTVRHDAGSARLRIGDLDANQQLVFGLDADLAMVAETREREEGAAYDQWIDKQLVAVKDADEKKAMAANDAEEASARKRAMLLARIDTPQRERPLAQGASSVSYRFSRSYTNYSGYTPSYRYYYRSSGTPFSSAGGPGTTSYVGSSRSNSANRSASSPFQSYGGRSSCPTGAAIYTPRATPDSPTVSEP